MYLTKQSVIDAEKAAISGFFVVFERAVCQVY